MCDTYWMRPLDDDTEDAASTARQICEGFKLALFAHAQSMASLLAAEKKQNLAKPYQEQLLSRFHFLLLNCSEEHPLFYMSILCNSAHASRVPEEKPPSEQPHGPGFCLSRTQWQVQRSVQFCSSGTQLHILLSCCPNSKFRLDRWLCERPQPESGE